MGHFFVCVYWTMGVFSYASVCKDIFCVNSCTRTPSTYRCGGARRSVRTVCRMRQICKVFHAFGQRFWASAQSEGIGEKCRCTHFQPCNNRHIALSEGVMEEYICNSFQPRNSWHIALETLNANVDSFPLFVGESQYDSERKKKIIFYRFKWSNIGIMPMLLN